MGFGAICDDPMVELLRIRQKTSVDAYHEEFNSIITRLKLSDDHILRCFLGGLKKEIQMLVSMFRPQSLQHVFTLARTYEGNNSSNLMAKFLRGVLDPTPVPILSSASINVEMEEDDSYDSPPSDVTELLQRKEPQISVNALTIVVGFRTMRIDGYHKKMTFTYSH